jgi:hypothetical protein
MIRGGITQSAIEVAKGLQFVSRAYGALEKLPQAVGAEKYAFDFVGHPNAEGSPTASGSMSITAQDARSPNGFVQLVVLIIATQEAVLDEGSHSLAMRTGSHFELGQQIVEFLLGRTDPATHDWDLPTGRKLLKG